MRYVETHELLEEDGEFISGDQMSNGSDHIVGVVSSDVDGTLYIEQGYPEYVGGPVHWTVTKQIEVKEDEGQGFVEPIVAPKWRLRYANSVSEAQTSFDLHARATSAGPRE